MQFVGKVISSVSEFYRDINPATLSGAIDVIVVENIETGELSCSPFHVRFGKLQLLRPQEKAVELKINDIDIGEELRMKVGEAGETFFVLPKEELGWGGGSDLPMEYLTSPLVGPETPGPIESIEEFKLEKTGKAETVLTATEQSDSNSLASPEWKWKWGDLPMKNNEFPNDPESPPQTTPLETVLDQPQIVPTIEFYEYLSSKDYIIKLYESLARFPARSMITRIFRIDRGLHFNPSAMWPEQLASPSFLNESVRLVESDFLINPNVVIEESSRLVYQFTWENRKVVLGGSVGAAIVFYAQTYARILPLEIILKLSEIATIRMAKRKFSKSFTTFEEEDSGNVGEIEGDVQKLSEDDGKSEPIPIVPSSDSQPAATQLNLQTSKSSWRSWWSRSSAANNININSTDSISIPNSSVNNIPIASTPPKSLSKNDHQVSVQSSNTHNITNENYSEKSPSKTTIVQIPSNLSAGSVMTLSSPTSSLTSTTTSSTTPSTAAIKRSTNPAFNKNQQYIKSLRLPSHLLKRLNLKPGVNTISYTVNTRLQGTATCQSRIFLWRSDARVVISDIDGTITKSDALGHLFTMVGKDWTHVGVAQLYSKIAANGYEFLYLTSRAIGQAASTRGYLKGVEQDRLQLPDGPVIMSPDRLFTALHREVIQRRPDEFKIACLRDIQKLFVADDEEVSMMGSGVISSSEDEYSGVPSNSSKKDLFDSVTQSSVLKVPSSTRPSPNLSIISTSTSSYNPVTIQQNPFYAGFGNRPTDTKSYKAVGISASRIFLINPAGDLKLDKLTFYTPYSASSYSKLTEEVDKVFPPVRSPSSLTRVAGDEAFTDFQYWHELGGDVRMDLVQMALGTLLNPKRKVDALLDENGKPVSPRQLGVEGGGSLGTSSSTSLFYSQYSSTSELITSSTKSASTPPALPPRPKSAINGDYANDADSEEDEDSEGEDETIDSFPFI